MSSLGWDQGTRVADARADYSVLEDAAHDGVALAAAALGVESREELDPSLPDHKSAHRKIGAQGHG